MSAESSPALLGLANTGAACQVLHLLLPSLLLTVATVLQEGELPSEMVPKHNDDPYNDDEEEEQEQERAPKAAKLLKPIDSAGVRMPLKLTSSLTGECKYMQCLMPRLDSDSVSHLRCCMPTIAWPVCCRCIPVRSPLLVWCAFLMCCLLCATKALSHACVALYQSQICSEPSASLHRHTHLFSGLVNCFLDRTQAAAGSKPLVCCAVLSLGRIEYMHPAFKDMKQNILASHHPVCCVVLSLGRIEYLHPAFHDVKNFWPVGYCVDRLAATPASGKKETLHRCQILEAPDGSGPLFR